MEEIRQAKVYGVRPARTFEQAAAKFVLETGSCWFKWGAGGLAEELSQIGSTRLTWWRMSPRACCREPAVSFKSEDAEDGSEGCDGVPQGGHERLIALEFGIGDTENVAKHAVARVVTYVDEGPVAGAERKDAERAIGDQVGIVDHRWTRLAADPSKTVAHQIPVFAKMRGMDEFFEAISAVVPKQGTWRHGYRFARTPLGQLSEGDYGRQSCAAPHDVRVLRDVMTGASHVVGKGSNIVGEAPGMHEIGHDLAHQRQPTRCVADRVVIVVQGRTQHEIDQDSGTGDVLATVEWNRLSDLGRTDELRCSRVR